MQTAIDGETYEFTVMYPGFIRDAEEEAANQAKRAFSLANEAEKVHAELYRKALAALEKRKTWNISYAQCADISMKTALRISVPFVVRWQRHLKM